MQKALVTGATGLLGSHLLFSLLERGYEVTAIVRTLDNIQKTAKIFSFYSDNTNELISRVKWVEGELLDAQFIHTMVVECDIVFHCAAQVSFSPFKKDEVIRVNTEITANIVDAALESGKRLIHVSSIASLSSANNGTVVDESCLWKSVKGENGYAISKFYSEMEVWRGIELGLNAAIVNPAVIIGPGAWNSGSPYFFKAVKNGLPFYTLGGTGFVDVRDVATAMAAIADRDISGERFILVGDNILYKEFFNTIAQSIGCKPPRIAANRLLLSLGWRFEYLRCLIFGGEPVMTKELARTAHRVTTYSAQKAIDTLGIRFKGIAGTVEHTARCFEKM